MRLRLSLGILLLICSVFLGCSQREGDVGANAIVGVPNNAFKILSGTATHSTDFHPPYTNGGATSMEVGDAKHIFAFIALRFETRSGLPDSLQVDTLRVRLCRISQWPPSGFPGLQINVRFIPDSVTWTQGNLVPGSLAGRADYPKFDSVTVISTTDAFLEISIPNPQEVWNQWHHDTTQTHGGLLIEPRVESSGGTGGFVEFYSREGAILDTADVRPALLISGRAWVSDTTFSPHRDTLTYANNDGYLAIDSTDIDPASAAQHRQHFIISQGFSQRAALYFPVDTIISNYTRSVSRAQLHLFLDTTAATSEIRIPLPGEDMILNHGFLLSKVWLTQPDSLTLTSLLGPEAGATGYSLWDNTGSEAVFDVTGIVATWIADSSRNDGIEIFWANEFGTLARETFYGADADSLNKRPRLDIWYTEISH